MKSERQIPFRATVTRDGQEVVLEGLFRDETEYGEPDFCCGHILPPAFRFHLRVKDRASREGLEAVAGEAREWVMQVPGATFAFRGAVHALGESGCLDWRLRVLDPAGALPPKPPAAISPSPHPKPESHSHPPPA